MKKNNLVNNLWDIHHKMSEGILLTKKGTRFPFNSLYAFKSSIQWFERYVATLPSPLLSLPEGFENKYVSFLILQNLRNNSIHGHCKRLRILFKHLNINIVFSISEEEVTTVYLSEQELDRFEKVSVKNAAQFETQRRFLIACATGLRNSDLSRVVANPEKYLIQYEGKWCLHIRQQKTNGSVVIPLSAKTLGFLRETKFKIKSSQTYNATLKRIAKAAGIDQEVLIEYTMEGKRREEQVTKYKLVSSHTARRSFATNAFLAGIPTLSIMRITGHKTNETFMQYIRISRVENAIALAEHSFFQ